MKKALVLFLCLSAALLARAGWMYWMIDQTGADPDGFVYAMISASGGGLESATYLSSDNGYTLFLPNDANVETALGTKTDVTYTSLAQLGGSFDGDSLSFVVELYNAEFQKIGVSDPVSYSFLSSKYIYDDKNLTGINPYVFTAAAVPEPTGGVLVLLGIGLLGLRRKRV